MNDFIINLINCLKDYKKLLSNKYTEIEILVIKGDISRSDYYTKKQLIIKMLEKIDSIKEKDKVNKLLKLIKINKFII